MNLFFFCKEKTAYELRIGDWSSDVCSSDLPYVVDNHHLFVGASIGFAIGPTDGATVETLTRNADLALYKSKDKGGNVVAAYVASLHAQAEERRVMEQELRGALERGEFELYYQPVVTAADGTLNGFEALIRWHNKKLGNEIGRAHV